MPLDVIMQYQTSDKLRCVFAYVKLSDFFEKKSLKKLLET